MCLFSPCKYTPLLLLTECLGCPHWLFLPFHCFPLVDAPLNHHFKQQTGTYNNMEFFIRLKWRRSAWIASNRTFFQFLNRTHSISVKITSKATLPGSGQMALAFNSWVTLRTVFPNSTWHTSFWETYITCICFFPKEGCLALSITRQAVRYNGAGLWHANGFLSIWSEEWVTSWCISLNRKLSYISQHRSQFWKKHSHYHVRNWLPFPLDCWLGGENVVSFYIKCYLLFSWTDMLVRVWNRHQEV